MKKYFLFLMAFAILAFSQPVKAADTSASNDQNTATAPTNASDATTAAEPSTSAEPMAAPAEAAATATEPAAAQPAAPASMNEPAPAAAAAEPAETAPAAAEPNGTATATQAQPAADNLEFVSGEISSVDEAAKSITVKLYGENENQANDKILTVTLDSATDITDGEKDRDLKSLTPGTEVDVEYDPATKKATYIFVY